MHSNHRLTFKSSPLFLSVILFTSVAGFMFPCCRPKFSFPKKVIVSLHSSEALKSLHLSLCFWITLPYLHSCAVSGSYGCNGAHASLHPLVEDSGSTEGAHIMWRRQRFCTYFTNAHPVHSAAFKAVVVFLFCGYVHVAS